MTTNTTTTAQQANLDAILEDARAAWRAEHPEAPRYDPDASDNDPFYAAVEELVAPLVPAGRAELLELAGDRRVWELELPGTPVGDHTLGAVIRLAVEELLVEAVIELADPRRSVDDPGPAHAIVEPGERGGAPPK